MIFLLLAAAELEPRVTLETNGTAFFVHKGKVLRDADLFEPIQWVEQPSSEVINQLFPSDPSTTLYAHISCKQISNEGRLSRCSLVERGYDAETTRTGKTLLRAMSSYRMSEADAARFKPRLDNVDLDIAIRFRGVESDGPCWIHGFCALTPPPPPPPATHE
jgi:hypothetical protein